MTVDRDGALLLMNDQARKLSALASSPLDDRPIMSTLLALGLARDSAEDALRRLWDGAIVRLRNEVPTDGPIPLVEVTGTPTRDADGEVAGAVWVLRDISHIARAEHERAKAAHLQSIGVLAGGLAHDVNNILMGIVGNLSLAESLVRPDETALATRLNHASAACARARGVTSQLLTFAKGGAPIKTTSSVRELVVECSRFALSGSPVAPRFTIDDNLWAADVDLDQIGQVVHNLVLNALQAMPRGGVVDVSLANEELGEDASLAMTGLAPGRYVRLTVQDQGHGIPPDTLDRIFDPYFTTKEFGSGLGLAITYSIVHAHGGAITVAFAARAGRPFHDSPPRLRASGRARSRCSPPPSCAARAAACCSWTTTRWSSEVAEEMLQSLGYITEATPSGELAIERFRAAEERGEPFDVVILDLTVAGGMGGAEVRRPHPAYPCRCHRLRHQRLYGRLGTRPFPRLRVQRRPAKTVRRG